MGCFLLEPTCYFSRYFLVILILSEFDSYFVTINKVRQDSSLNRKQIMQNQSLWIKVCHNVQLELVKIFPVS